MKKREALASTRTISDQPPEALRNTYLLSVFPTKRLRGFARLTCRGLVDKNQASSSARVVDTVQELTSVLSAVFSQVEVDTILEELDKEEFVQTTITGERAKLLGFVV